MVSAPPVRLARSSPSRATRPVTSLFQLESGGQPAINRLPLRARLLGAGRREVRGVRRWHVQRDARITRLLPLPKPLKSHTDSALHTHKLLFCGVH